jgi:phospholipid transport system substrate-binding protein
LNKTITGVCTVIPSLSRRGAFVWLVALALAVPAVTARADTAPDARQFIDKLVNHALQILVQTKTNESEREQNFDLLLRNNFDIPRIARFVLGRYWAAASTQDRQKFIDTYRDFVIKSYASQFSEYRGETVKVTNARAEDADITVVNSEIVHPNGDPPIRVSWRVHRDGDTYKIVDVDVEGVSMMLAQREEFASVIQRNGGTVAGLIQAIQQKLQGAEPPAGGKS